MTALDEEAAAQSIADRERRHVEIDVDNRRCAARTDREQPQHGVAAGCRLTVRGCSGAEHKCVIEADRGGRGQDGFVQRDGSGAAHRPHAAHAREGRARDDLQRRDEPPMHGQRPVADACGLVVVVVVGVEDQVAATGLDEAVRTEQGAGEVQRVAGVLDVQYRGTGKHETVSDQCRAVVRLRIKPQTALDTEASDSGQAVVAPAAVEREVAAETVGARLAAGTGRDETKLTAGVDRHHAPRWRGVCGDLQRALIHHGGAGIGFALAGESGPPDTLFRYAAGPAPRLF